MFNESEILTRLQNGEDPGDIANQFADMLNKVIADIQEANERESLEAQKSALATEIAEDMLEYIHLSAPDLYECLIQEDIDVGEAMQSAIDSTIKGFRKIYGIYENCASLLKPTGKPDVCKATVRHTKDGKTTTLTGDAAIDEFLNMFGLK